ncbi:MAG: plastocyanin/azurin family copper-binding protein [Egibacteraceae bacterium]
MRRATVCALLALLLSGCGGGAPAGQGEHGEEHGSDSAVVEGVRVIDVAASSFLFDPEQIVVGAGESVTIAVTSADTFHDLIIEGVAFHVSAQPGSPAEAGLRIAEPGTYTGYCSVPGHREAGMELTISVQ